MCAQRARAIHVVVGRILHRVILLAVDGDGLGVVVYLLTYVVLRDVTREHNHEGATLLDVRAYVVEVQAVVVRRLEVGITLRDVLRIRHIVDILQVTHIGVVGVGIEEYADGVLGVERDVTHHEVCHMVVVALDVLALNQAIECRVLIVDIRDEGIAVLRPAEARTYAVLRAAAIGV